ncbi:helix-turn-helix domain-containing protein [Streptomyces somaliensis DSM 40738]|uniref:Helix-turn-helix transcriptional regulator n=1 Tax=Streptomyces somaliensis (strain ATCC 33201 / DSM 40738 / JCM 12659 / KCTC 9044 / NCTC 11332 / NRRL B-12077 / IP 733) TaxID=1134445 RepID=A0AA44DDM1_STRE0|nr:helix-turn-helix domain-containing protein [Streptomyces somaliensis]MCQ0023978.1 helix-turn-helix domain-containing protein [Streptomyces somaliensis DSM 40738]NKY14231.1 helix-turn-helix transcriptional regulator [Streptomyces somaliensis DSM 40738]
MDSTHPIWRSAAMRDALARRDAGAIVRLTRRAADITLAELGRQVGYTAASLSRMERGKQPMRDVLLLQRIADCLDIPPYLLGLAPRHGGGTPDRTGTTRVGTHTLSGEGGDDPVRRRHLLAALAGATTSAVLPPTAAAHTPPPSLSGLEDLLLHRHHGQALAVDPTPSTVTAAVHASRRDFSDCRYDALARALPGRIALAQALSTGGHTEQAATAVAELYTTATRLCIKLGEDGLAAVTADRALTAALGGADALTVAEAHRMVSSAWRRQGRHARATDIAVAAARQLAADRTCDATERLSVQGNLYATAAYTAAKQGDRHTAHALIAEAGATAGRLGRDAQLRGGVFGPGQVLLHRISVSHLLGDAGQAVELARRVDPAALPTTERRARYWIDVARAFDQWGKPDRCYRALLAAERSAPQEVRRDSVRTLTTGLLRHDRALPGVRAFAHRTGALV